MKIADYLKHKKIQKKEIEHKFSLIREKCYDCFRPKKNCFCHNLKSFKTKSKFIILMHPMEAKKIKIGTGRLTKVCLQNSRIIVGVDFTKNKEVNTIINDPNYYPFVLYPGERSNNLSKKPLDSLKVKDKTPLFFIIDGTWPSAKIMMRESLNLQKLDRVSFSTNELSRFHIKHQPDKFCLSTIESVFYLLSELDQWKHETLLDSHFVLLDALKRLVDFQMACARDPNLKSYRRSGNYKEPKDRVQNKKWLKRRVCYDEKNYF